MCGQLFPSFFTEGITGVRDAKGQAGGGDSGVGNALRAVRAAITAAINAGDSGGPLIDQCGRLVGVNTSGAATTVGDDGIETANGQFIASGMENLVAFLKRNGRTPTVDPRHCDRGRVVAARPVAPPASGAKPSILDDLRSGLRVTETSGAGLVRLARACVIQISGTLLAFVLIYVLFLRTRIRRWTAPGCPVPVTCDVPEKPA